MANHLSAKTRIRRNAKRYELNSSRMGRIRTFVKQVEAAISGGDKAAAQEALKAAQPEMHRGVRSGILHQNTVARKLSRMNSRIKALA
ncbi:30S ribosomal protein S20 [Kiloniella laminariae]|uniref:Small ribosomal subunit protein bS20 n=1 Tax=Kiloniella laminariae TaxID=454162 RepID=A0ABT4LIQ6_9PROT|nr:30S ribosomal protein S20 [Kiloniella laminariae]MCZ4280979.1 30S ribosomal protein S20 [Kiloniella laminariae]